MSVGCSARRAIHGGGSVAHSSTAPVKAWCTSNSPYGASASWPKCTIPPGCSGMPRSQVPTAQTVAFAVSAPSM
eukprot:3490591-Prymnesium_polylepis.1